MKLKAPTSQQLNLRGLLQTDTGMPAAEPVTNFVAICPLGLAEYALQVASLSV